MATYLDKVNKRLESIKAGTFNYAKGYQSYLNLRAEIGARRHLSVPLGFEAYKYTYKKALQQMSTGETPASYVNSVNKALVESEKLESAKQYRAWYKLSQKKYRETGDERFNISLADFRKYGYDLIEQQLYTNETKSFKEVFYV